MRLAGDTRISGMIMPGSQRFTYIPPFKRFFSADTTSGWHLFHTSIAFLLLIPLRVIRMNAYMV
jgi:hypothetical protein